nr:hypothetical protein [Paenibacillus frigoriresistens]
MLEQDLIQTTGKGTERIRTYRLTPAVLQNL